MTEHPDDSTLQRMLEGQLSDDEVRALDEHIDACEPCRQLLAALVIAVLCAALSPLVVLRRLAFVGQGVSHAGFAGIGLEHAQAIAFAVREGHVAADAGNGHRLAK